MYHLDSPISKEASTSKPEIGWQIGAALKELDAALLHDVRNARKILNNIRNNTDKNDYNNDLIDQMIDAFNRFDTETVKQLISKCQNVR